MNERGKITASHLARHAVVDLRQSSAAQVEHNRESTERQYALASKARELGWPAERIVIIDEDLGLSGGGTATRSGFARLTAEVALARVGFVLGTLGCVCDGVRSRALGRRKPGRSQGPAQAWSMVRVVEGNGCFAS